MCKIFRFLGILMLLCLLVGTAEAKKNRTKHADKAFQDHKYQFAIKKYKKAYSKIKNNREEKDRINYQLAECFRLINNRKRAEIQYKRLIRIDYQQKKPDILLHYADILKANKKYKEALAHYQAYQALVPDDPLAKNGIEACSMEEEWEKNTEKYIVKNLKKLNSREADFSPAYADNTYSSIIFTSTRDNATGKAKDEWTAQDFSDLFLSRAGRKQEWSKPVLFDNKEADTENTETINTIANEGNPAMNKNFSVLYYTKCMNDAKKVSGCWIYTAKRIGHSWAPPRPIVLGRDTSSIIGHPALSRNELTLFFASERPGGIGGKDIWMAKRSNAEEPFKRPQNLGAEINTPGNEMFPFLRGDTLLYFASDGHVGMGGLDIFVSRRKDDGTWSKPENIKAPFNSNGDDFGIIFHPAKEQGYFSSNRKGSKNEDIYFFEKPLLEFSLRGVVKNEKTLLFVENAIVELIPSKGRSFKTKTNELGVYYFSASQMAEDTDYEISISKDNFFNAKAFQSTKELSSGREIIQDFMLSPIPDEPVILPEILYDLAQWELKAQYQDSLQDLITKLDDNENLIVELASHTDARGSEEQNDILSQRRALAVVDYLIVRGIDPDRLIAKGYGERVPRKLNKDIRRRGASFKSGTVLDEAFINTLKSDIAKEAAHELNRRTEFKVVGKDFMPKPKNTEFDLSRTKISLNPRDKELSFTIDTATDFLQAKCRINDNSLDFTYKEFTEIPVVSLRQALRMLNEGIIDKNDFIGDTEKILANGTIANNSVFTIKELHIAHKTINNIQVRVDSRSKEKLCIGKPTLLKFGDFTIDKEKKKIIFK